MSDDAPVKPSREELVALLFSDPASEAWEGDAQHALAPPADGDDTRTDKIERIRGLIEIVGAEAGDAELGYENEREDLRDLACMGKRGAILLLVAAWAAERALQKPAKGALPRGGETSAEQLSFGGDSVTCSACGEPATKGRCAVHRDGFDEGPEVPICDACAAPESAGGPTMAEIHAAIAARRERAAGGEGGNMSAAILIEICEERARQDAQWGGPPHDDGHEGPDWLVFIGYQFDRAHRPFDRRPSGHPRELRERLVKVAALAVAAIESIDRKAAPAPISDGEHAGRVERIEMLNAGREQRGLPFLRVRKP